MYSPSSSASVAILSWSRSNENESSDGGQEMLAHLVLVDHLTHPYADRCGATQWFLASVAFTIACLRWHQQLLRLRRRCSANTGLRHQPLAGEVGSSARSRSSNIDCATSPLAISLRIARRVVILDALRSSRIRPGEHATVADQHHALQSEAVANHLRGYGFRVAGGASNTSTAIGRRLRCTATRTRSACPACRRGCGRGAPTGSSVPRTGSQVVQHKRVVTQMARSPAGAVSASPSLRRAHSRPRIWPRVETALSGFRARWPVWSGRR